jgi:hypothetical protein
MSNTKNPFKSLSIWSVTIFFVFLAFFTIRFLLELEPKGTKEIDFTELCKSPGIKKASDIIEFPDNGSKMCLVDLYNAGFLYSFTQDYIPIDVKVARLVQGKCEQSVLRRSGKIWNKNKDYYVWEGAPDGKWSGLMGCNSDRISVFIQGEAGYSVHRKSGRNNLDEYLNPPPVFCFTANTPTEVSVFPAFSALPKGPKHCAITFDD